MASLQVFDSGNMLHGNHQVMPINMQKKNGDIAAYTGRKSQITRNGGVVMQHKEP